MTPALVIAFLTGQSNPGNCALSPAQNRFLSALAGPERELVSVNFPYAATGPYQPTSLLRASWNNAYLYLNARRRGFAEKYREPVAAVIKRGGHAVFLCGSCGLELFNNLALPPALEDRCTLICYGPVARRLPARARTVIAQSKRDFLSRRCFPNTEALLRCGHMGYLDDPGFMLVCQKQLAAMAPAQ